MHSHGRHDAQWRHMRQVHFRASRAYLLVSESKEARVSYTVIKTIGGRQYEYLQTSYREGGKVKTKSVYIGPVGGRKRKKRGGGFPPVNPAAIVLGGIALAMHIAKHGVKSPDYKSRNRPPDPRSWDAQLAYERRKWAERIANAKGIRRTSAHPEQTEAWREFDERLAAKVARQTAQDAPGRTQEAPAKNFTVDDEIEARAAKFEAAVDEYNTGTTAAADAPAPDDAPCPSGPGEP
jgi:hypothetical protein